MTQHYDAVVVGSGPGGAVTTRALAEAGLKVLCLEEGPWVQPGSLPPYSLEQMKGQYRNQGLTVALGSPSVSYTEGLGVGGGSEVNSGLYHRLPEATRQAWQRQTRIEALAPADLLPHQQYVERELGVDVLREHQGTAASDVLATGAERLGWAHVDVPRWVLPPDSEGGGPRKQTMSRTYIPAAITAGAVIREHCRAIRVTHRAGVVTGVEVEHTSLTGGQRVEHVSTDTVFVCAGSIHSPALLLRSRVPGTSRRLIGRNLSVHATVKVVAEFDEEINPGADLPTRQVKHFPGLSMGGSASRPELIALALSENWKEFGRHQGAWRNQCVYYAAIVPTGVGRVRVAPGLRDPIVTYHLTRQDGARLEQGLSRLMHLLLTAGARRLMPSYAGAPVVTDAAGLAAAHRAFNPRTAPVMTVHLCGTVGLGGDGTSPADSFGRIAGTRGLYVNDSSMLPSAPGVNPQGTVMALAHRNVAQFLQERG